jgi:hypothetical protein
VLLANVRDRTDQLAQSWADAPYPLERRTLMKPASPLQPSASPTMRYLLAQSPFPVRPQFLALGSSRPWAGISLGALMAPTTAFERGRAVQRGVGRLIAVCFRSAARPQGWSGLQVVTGN